MVDVALIDEGGRRRVLDELAVEIVGCARCPRLVDWREQVAVQRRAAYADQIYWGRPVPGFGDPAARVLVVGLAPAAHGANRTGRVFTGDRSGDWLFRAMYRAGLANQATSVGRDDGLELSGAWVTAAVKCAPPQNRPTPGERDACAEYFGRELKALDRVAVIVALGAFGFSAICRALGVRPQPRFGHGVEVPVIIDAPDGVGKATGGDGSRAGGVVVLGCFHPSQQNTFTGRLTESMLDAVFTRAVELAGLDRPAGQ